MMHRCGKCSTTSDRIRVVRGVFYCEPCYIEHIPCAQFSDPLGVIPSESSGGGGSASSRDNTNTSPSGSAMLAMLNRMAASSSSSSSSATGSARSLSSVSSIAATGSYSDLESSEESDDGNSSDRGEDDSSSSSSDEEMLSSTELEEEDDNAEDRNGAVVSTVTALGMPSMGVMQTRLSCSLCRKFPCSAVILCCTECRETNFCITCAPTARKSGELLFCSGCTTEVPRRRIQYLADAQLDFEKSVRVTCVFCEETVTLDKYSAHVDICEEVEEAPASTKARFDTEYRKILRTKQLLEKYQREIERDARWKRAMSVPLDSIDAREEEARAQAYQESCRHQSERFRMSLLAQPPVLFDCMHAAASIKKPTFSRRKRKKKAAASSSSSSRGMRRRLCQGVSSQSLSASTAIDKTTARQQNTTNQKTLWTFHRFF